MLPKKELIYKRPDTAGETLINLRFYLNLKCSQRGLLIFMSHLLFVFPLFYFFFLKGTPLSSPFMWQMLMAITLESTHEAAGTPTADSADMSGGSDTASLALLCGNSLNQLVCNRGSLNLKFWANIQNVFSFLSCSMCPLHHGGYTGSLSGTKRKRRTLW